MRTILFIFCFVLFIVGSIAFKAPVANCNLLVKDSLKVTKELKQIKDFDQTYRTRYYLSYRDSFQYLKDSIESLQEVIDRKNHIKLTALINKYSYNCLAAKYYGRFFASIFSHMPDDIMQSYEKDKLNERKFQILEMLETPIEENQKKELEKELSEIIIHLAKIK